MLRTKRLASKEQPEDEPPLEAEFQFTADDVNAFLVEVDPLAGDPYARLPTEYALHQTLSGIFSAFTMDLYTEPENDFDFRGVSSISSVSNYSECGGEDVTCRTVVSTINLQNLDAATAALQGRAAGVPPIQAVKRLLCEEVDPEEQQAHLETVYKYLLILRSYLKRYSEALYPSVSANLKHSTDPLEINRQFVIITSFWNDFRGKLAMCIGLFDEMGVDQVAVRSMFHYCMVHDIFDKETLQTISQLLCTSLSLKQLRAPHPRLVLIRRVFSIFCAAVAQDSGPLLLLNDAEPPPTAPDSAPSGSLSLHEVSDSSAPLSVVRVPSPREGHLQAFFSSLVEALKAHLSTVAGKPGKSVQEMAFSLFFELSRTTELSAFCLQREAGEDVPSRCERFLLAKEASDLRGYPRDHTCVGISSECRSVLRAEPQLRDLRRELLEMVFSSVLRTVTSKANLIADHEELQPVLRLLHSAALELDAYTGGAFFAPGEARLGKGLRGASKSGKKVRRSGFRQRLFREISGALERSVREYLLSYGLLECYSSLPRVRLSTLLSNAPLTHLLGLNLVEAYLMTLSVGEAFDGSELFLSSAMLGFTNILNDESLYQRIRAASGEQSLSLSKVASDEQQGLAEARIAACILSLIDALLRYACLLHAHAAVDPSLALGSLSLSSVDPVFSFPFLIICRDYSGLPGFAGVTNGTLSSGIPYTPPDSLSALDDRVMSWLEAAGGLLGRFPHKEEMLELAFKLSFNRLIAFPTSEPLLLFEQQAYRALTQFLSRQSASQVYSFLLQLECSHNVTCQTDSILGKTKECVLVTTPFYRENAHLQTPPEPPTEDFLFRAAPSPPKAPHFMETPESRRRVWMDLIQRFGNYSTSPVEAVFEQAAPVDVVIFRIGHSLVMTTYELQEVFALLLRTSAGLSRSEVAEVISQCRRKPKAVSREAIDAALTAVAGDVDELYSAVQTGRVSLLDLSNGQLVLSGAVSNTAPSQHIVCCGSLLLNVCRDVYWLLGDVGDLPAKYCAVEGAHFPDFSAGPQGTELIASVGTGDGVGGVKPAGQNATAVESVPNARNANRGQRQRLHDSMTAGMLLNSFLVQTVKMAGSMPISDLISKALSEYRFAEEDSLTPQAIQSRIERLVDLDHLTLRDNILSFEIPE